MQMLVDPTLSVAQGSVTGSKPTVCPTLRVGEVRGQPGPGGAGACSVPVLTRTIFDVCSLVLRIPGRGLNSWTLPESWRPEPQQSSRIPVFAGPPFQVPI